MDLDKLREEYWNRSFPDRQEAKVITHCDFSGREIFEGEQYLLMPDGVKLKDDFNVLIEYLDIVFVVAGEEE